MVIKKNYYDFKQECFYPVLVKIVEGVIERIERLNEEVDGFVLPGLIDSHVHIESSMMVPKRFAECAVRYGVVSVVADPHEIANVMGVDGVKYMIDSSKNTLLKFNFMAPSCVPATFFETSGAVVSGNEIEELMKLDDIKGLGEMMNFPGVLYEDETVLNKINTAKRYNKPIDGHAPCLSGVDLIKYAGFGISTDHEASTYEEALEKIKSGMTIQIREGSAAKNFDSLWKLVDEFPDKVMLCSDDIHPDDFLNGYINLQVKRLIEKGVSLSKIYKAAFFNPISHYKLNNIGKLAVGDSADFIIVDDLKSFNIEKTFINGECVYDSFHQRNIEIERDVINNFNTEEINVDEIKIFNKDKSLLNVIKLFDGELLTEKLKISIVPGEIVSDIKNDCLKIVVYNRYNKSKPAIAFINGFNLKKGAIASSISHDSHNIIAVGVSDSDIVNAINLVVKNKGGICIVNNEFSESLILEIGGLMSTEKPEYIAEKYSILNQHVKNFGCSLHSPFMTLSFMALLVIPKLKLSDKGLFDGQLFRFTDLME